MRKFFVLVLLLFLSCGVLAKCSNSQIDINSATSKELEKIVWVGPATAQKIIDGRPFETLDDLDKVKGIGATKLSDIKEEGLACVSEENIEEEEVKEETKRDIEIFIEEPKTEEVDSAADEPILLNGDTKGRELIYESKNAKISSYFPYAFSLFLIFVIVVLLIDK